MTAAPVIGLFQGLLPMLANRVVILTVADAGNGVLSLSVIPKKLTDDESDALTTPLSITATAEELDRDLPRQLREFTGVHAAASSNLAQIKQELQAAQKAAADERLKKTNAKKTPDAPKISEPPRTSLNLFETSSLEEGNRDDHHPS